MLQQELNAIITRHGRELFPDAFITITGIKVSPDVSDARVYLSVYKRDDKASVINILTHNVKAIRKELGDRIRYKVRRIPALQFFLDESLDNVYKMEQIFKDLDKPS